MSAKQWLINQFKTEFKIPYWYFALGPALLFGIGFALNAIVMGLNYGQMPVLLPGCTVANMNNDVIHTCMKAASHLKILSDWIVVRDSGVYSPGDFFEMASDYTFKPGLLAWVILVIRDFNK